MSMLFPQTPQQAAEREESPAEPPHVAPGDVIFPSSQPEPVVDLPAGTIFPEDPSSPEIPTLELAQPDTWAEADAPFLNGFEHDVMAWDLGTWCNPFVPAEPDLPETITIGDPVIPMHLFT